ncbi:kinase-like domain-containing protein [Rhizophagus diaphanus]|nr:kinase-like domain-containing protein [Rhizophagus diaphanus] [Rhizophagus sp. MUCL 43196]
MKPLFKPSGSKIIDEFIRHTQINYVRKEGKLEFIPYDQFKNIEFIAEGGFSKIYKAIWKDGPISKWDNRSNIRQCDYTVALKKLNNSKDITHKGLNELKIFYNFSLKWKASRMYSSYKYISNYFGITRDPVTEDIMIVMPYYNSGDLIYYITKVFYEIKWEEKLKNLIKIIIGLMNIHSVNIVHRDLHSGNIFFDNTKSAIIGDLGISKSATESTDDNNNENYGIIPYMAPEIFQGQKYIKASDIYSFGMVMWELMTGRRPFWNRNHDTELIIEICDGLRPPIVTNTPKGYVELMKECWHPDPEKRPNAINIYQRVRKIFNNEWNNHFRKQKPTEIIESSDIGPVTKNNPGAIYKSRPLSGMINSAMSLRSSRSRLIKISSSRLIDTDYISREFEFDI